jgi:hypothetical protein
MGIRLINYVNNQLQTPALYTNALAQRPTYGIYGRLFMSTDTKEIYQDLATSWQLLADAGAGSGTLQSVTTNGSSTTTGITILSNNLALTNATSNFYIKALTIGSILFSGDSSGLVTQDNANFFWDNTNKRLGIGTAAPSSKLDIHSTGINATFNGTSTNNAYLVFQNAGTSKWYVGNLYSGAVANDFVIYDFANSAYRLYIHNTGVVNIPTSLIIGSATPTSSYTFDLTGTAKVSSTLLVNGIATFSSDVNASGKFKGRTSGSGIAFETTNAVDADFSIETVSGGTTKIGTSGNKLAINSGGGNVLIGSTTDQGNWKAQVTGNLFIRGSNSASSATSLYIDNSGGTTLFSVRNDGVINTGLAPNSPYNRTTVTLPNVLVDNDGSLYRSTSSSKRFKENIQDWIGNGLNTILALKPKTFTYKEGYYNNPKLEMLGLIAEEVSEVSPFLAEYENEDRTGQVENVRYATIVVPLIKAIQELNEKLVRNNIN